MSPTTKVCEWYVSVCVCVCVSACVGVLCACVGVLCACVYEYMCVDDEFERKLNLLLLPLMQYIMQIMSYCTTNGLDL